MAYCVYNQDVNFWQEFVEIKSDSVFLSQSKKIRIRPLT